MSTVEEMFKNIENSFQDVKAVVAGPSMAYNFKDASLKALESVGLTVEQYFKALQMNQLLTLAAGKVVAIDAKSTMKNNPNDPQLITIDTLCATVTCSATFEPNKLNSNYPETYNAKIGSDGIWEISKYQRPDGWFSLDVLKSNPSSEFKGYCADVSKFIADHQLASCYYDDPLGYGSGAGNTNSYIRQSENILTSTLRNVVSDKSRDGGNKPETIKAKELTKS